MTLIHAESFDRGNGDHPDLYVSGQWGWTAGRKRGQALRSDYNTTLEVRPQTAMPSEGYFGFAYRQDNNNYTSGDHRYGLISLVEGSRHLLTISRGTDLNLEVRRHAWTSGQYVSLDDAPIVANAWNYIEVYYKLGAGTNDSHVKVWLNNLLVFDDAVTDWSEGGLYRTPTKFYAYPYPHVSSGYYDYDDFYLVDTLGTANNSRLGPVKVDDLLPNADGTYNAFTGSDGNQTDNWALVDDWSATDYVYSTADGQKQTFALADLATTVTSVLGVAMDCKWGARPGSTAKVRTLLRTNAQDFTGAWRGMTDVDSEFKVFYEKNPATAALWTVAEVNALEVGVETGPTV